MPNASRHNESRAGTIFQGSAQHAAYQGGKDGIENTPAYIWRPKGNLAVTFTGGLAAGVSTATLSGNWGPPTGFYNMTLSNGQVVNAWLIQGSTAVVFYQQLPLAGQALATVNTQSAVTSSAVVAGVPPIVGAATQIAASQAIAAAGFAVLNGTLLSYITSGFPVTINGVTYNGNIVTVNGNQYTPAIYPDVPRNVVAAWTTSSTIKVSGFDVYGLPMTESQTGTSFTGKKAFAVITSITSTASITAFTAGFGNVIGMPFAVATGDFLGAVFNDNVETTGTFVQADFTYPATTSTGDPRGTYVPAGTLNGAKFFNCELKVYDTASEIGSFGQLPA
jgi:hypothetical protein